MTATESATTPGPSLPHQRRRRALHARRSARTSSTSTPTSATWRSACHPVAASDRRQLLYNGRPARFTFKNFQVVGSNEQLDEVGVKDRGSSDEEGGQVIPGSLLNRLNPLKDLDAEGRKEFAKKYRAMQEQLDNPADRLTVMDSQGIESAVNFATLPGTEVEFEDDFDGLYANLTALNRYLGTEWGFNYENRLFTPPFISFADPDAALAQLEDIMKIEMPKVIQTSSGPSMHTSPFRPENDRFWSICSEAGIKLATHLASVTRYAAQGEEWNEAEVMLGDMDAFQWVFYYGDRPAYETVGAAILQGWFARFPKMQLLLSEQGTVWAPYIIRKLDHAFLMGRRATWGKLDDATERLLQAALLRGAVPGGERRPRRRGRGHRADRVRLRLPPRRRAARAAGVSRPAEELLATTR